MRVFGSVVLRNRCCIALTYLLAVGCIAPLSMGGELGACCFPDGNCHELPELVCIEMGGEFFPDSNCIDDPCSSTGDELGACCWGPFCMEVTEAECVSWEQPMWLGVGVRCSVTACSDDPGACCIDGICVLTYEDGCAAMGGEFHGNGIPCQIVGCYPATITGACCLPHGGCDQYTESECDAFKGVFGGGGVSCKVADCQVCVGDLDGDGVTGVDDLLMVLEGWGGDGSGSDANGDGTTDVDDLLVIIGQWGMCMPARFSGGAEDLPGVLSIDGQKDEPFTLDMWLNIRVDEDEGLPGPIPVEVVELHLSGVSPVFGQMTLKPVVINGTLDDDEGLLHLEGLFDLYGPAIDEVVPPLRPWPGADHFEHASQRYAITIDASTQRQPDGSIEIVEGMIDGEPELPDSLLLPIAGIGSPLFGVVLQFKIFDDEACPPQDRCNAKELCVQPVFIIFEGAGGEQLTTGTTFEAGKAIADAFWAKACVEFDWREPMILDDMADYAELRIGASGLSMPSQFLMSEIRVEDCIEIFFVDVFKPADVMFAFTFLSGMDSSKIVLQDHLIDEEFAFSTLAHELGHVMYLDDLDEAPDNLLNGFYVDSSPRYIRQWQMQALDNPLLKEKTPKEECCQEPD